MSAPENPERLFVMATESHTAMEVAYFQMNRDLAEADSQTVTEYIRADIAAEREEAIVRTLSAVQDEREALRARYHSADEGRCSIAKEASALAARLAEVTAERDGLAKRVRTLRAVVSGLASDVYVVEDMRGVRALSIAAIEALAADDAAGGGA